ncbi:MAG: 30S ribosomal protein S16 [Anaerolineae bacterium]|jgi:small subunit ribosomal protein S16
MLRIRLRRVGAKGRPAYRIVVADSRSPRDGRFIEIIGSYNPLVDPPVIEVEEERLNYWRSQGAQCSETVERLLATRERRGTAEAAAPAEPVAVSEPEAAVEAAEEEESEEATEAEES